MRGSAKRLDSVSFGALRWPILRSDVKTSLGRRCDEWSDVYGHGHEKEVALEGYCRLGHQPPVVEAERGEQLVDEALLVAVTQLLPHGHQHRDRLVTAALPQRLQVRDDGLEFDGVMFPSLTAVAKHVTGCRSINGRLFWGLSKRKRS